MCLRPPKVRCEGRPLAARYTALSQEGSLVTGFRIVSIVEGISYILLLGTTISYRAFDGPDITALLGMPHGILWVLYVVLVLPVAAKVGWGIGATLFAFVASVIPFATFYVERRMLSSPSPGQSVP